MSDVWFEVCCGFVESCVVGLLWCTGPDSNLFLNVVRVCGDGLAVR